MREQILQYIKKFEQLKESWKGLILFAFLLIIFLIWQMGFWSGLQQRKTRTMRQITRAERNITQIKRSTSSKQQELQQLSKKKLTVSEQQQLLAEQAGAKQRVKTQLIAPEQMVEILREMLYARHDLVLLSLRTLPAQPLKQPGSSKLLYQYGVNISFSGNFFAVMRYLQDLENLHWRFFWDQLNYKVDNYPQATVSLQLHTLSAQVGWRHG